MTYDPARSWMNYPTDLMNDGVAAGSSNRNTVPCVASATPHAGDGTLQVLDASLSADSDGLVITVVSQTAASGVDSSTLLEIYTGGSGSEVLRQTICVGYITEPYSYILPGHFAAGTRVTARARSATTVKAVSFLYEFLPKKTLGLAFGGVTSYGVTTASSRGTALTAPGSLNTKGAWLSFSASTAAAVAAITLTIQAAGQTVLTANGVLIDIAINRTLPNEQIISDIYFAGQTTETWWPGIMPTTFGVVNAPVGSTLEVRYARANASNTVDAILNVAAPG